MFFHRAIIGLYSFDLRNLLILLSLLILFSLNTWLGLLLLILLRLSSLVLLFAFLLLFFPFFLLSAPLVYEHKPFLVLFLKLGSVPGHALQNLTENFEDELYFWINIVRAIGRLC